MMHVFFRGLKSSANFLIATRKRFLDISSIFSVSLQCICPVFIHIPVKLIYLYFILSSLFFFYGDKNGPYQL